MQFKQIAVVAFITPVDDSFVDDDVDIVVTFVLRNVVGFCFYKTFTFNCIIFALFYDA